MTRLRSFTSPFGMNWLIGRYLLPLLDEWGDKMTGTIIDLGCGESPFRFYFKHADKYVRVDRIKVDGQVIFGDLLNIPFEDESVDSVLLFQALSDVPTPGDCLADIARVLKKGGLLIVFESMSYPEHDIPNDYYRIMPYGLEFLSKQNGFLMEDVIRLGGFFTRCSMLWNMAWSRLTHYPVVRYVGTSGILLGNIIFFMLDRIFSNPRFASDYCARLRKF